MPDWTEGDRVYREGSSRFGTVARVNAGGTIDIFWDNDVDCSCGIPDDDKLVKIKRSDK